jgi:photosystem II stability/assembly factor-like uncharacterized protein
MKNFKKSVPIFFSIALLSAGCNFFSTTLPAGIIKTVNGGTDWQFSNKVASSTTASMAGLSISKIALDPSNRETVFAGAYNGGLYKSQDSGASWQNILSKILVYDFAVDPVDPKIIYAAGFYSDHGRVLRTTDGGASWNQVYNEESAGNPVRAIVLNPANVNQLVIGTAGGAVIKSADGGLSWQLANDFKDQINRILWQNNNLYVLVKSKGLFESTGFADNFSGLTNKLTATDNLIYTPNTVGLFSQVFVDVSGSELIYVTTDKGLYKSIDDGKNWNLVTALPVKLDDSPRAIAISNTSSNIVFTSVGSTIYKTLDGGATWQTQSVTSGGFVNYILIDPQLPQIVYGGVYNTQ